ncbi:Lipoprotein releasing system transmembrane protein LolC/LolE [hydrothermal vent metagenome]|uniref:Lipoprotein releasing system transmembrane protein LolC/LolE n=1 Tax=hydrothermal vent metagenome TaxID=652676 RepID=A0A3B1BIC5_9ZZZZ
MYKPLELFIGLRYTRSKRRNHFISFISCISMMGIMLGVVALIIVLSVMNGFHKEVRERILGMTSHATITAASGGLKNWEQVIELSKDHPRVVGQAPFVEGQVMLANGSNVSGAVLRGILPEHEPKVSDVAEHMEYGAMTDLEPGEYRIILGQELAYALGVSPGDKVTVVTPQTRITPAGAMPRFKRFTVAGVFEVGMGEYDRNMAIVHMQDARKLQRLGDAITGVRLKLDDLYLAPRVSRELANQLPGLYRISDWTRQHRNFFSALAMEKRMMGIILSLIVAVAAFNIVSTLVMVVTDKQADIAILRTLGISPRSVMAIFMVQGTTIGFIGTLLGIGGGVALALNLADIVKWFETTFNYDFLPNDVYYISDLPSDLHWEDVGLVSTSAFIITILATLYPAWLAARTPPAEALRYE